MDLEDDFLAKALGGDIVRPLRKAFVVRHAAFECNRLILITVPDAGHLGETGDVAPAPVHAKPEVLVRVKPAVAGVLLDLHDHGLRRLERREPRPPRVPAPGRAQTPGRSSRTRARARSPGSCESRPIAGLALAPRESESTEIRSARSRWSKRLGSHTASPWGGRRRGRRWRRACRSTCRCRQSLE